MVIVEKKHSNSMRLISLLIDITSRPSGVIGLSLVTFHVLMAIFGTQLTPYDYKEVNANLMLQGPSTAHWFGTDHLGRDTFSRTLLGGREAILITGIATPIAVMWGGFVGMFFGLVGGRLDEVLMRVVDAFLSLPWILKMLVYRASSATLQVFALYLFANDQMGEILAMDFENAGFNCHIWNRHWRSYSNPRFFLRYSGNPRVSRSYT